MAMSNEVRIGRYACGGYTTVVGNKLGWWERKIFAQSSSDITLSLVRKYAHRPDLLSYDVYGRSDLQWFIMQYNNISDVTTEFVEGTTVILPTGARLFGEMLVKVPRSSVR